MALITCVECGKRISNKHQVCPHCDTDLAGLSPEEIAKRERLQYRRLIFRVRMATYVGMTLVMLGLIIWYVTGEPGLGMPPGTSAILAIGIGFTVYVAAWVGLIVLRWQRPPTA